MCECGELSVYLFIPLKSYILFLVIIYLFIYFCLELSVHMCVNVESLRETGWKTSFK